MASLRTAQTTVFSTAAALVAAQKYAGVSVFDAGLPLPAVQSTVAILLASRVGLSVAGVLRARRGDRLTGGIGYGLLFTAVFTVVHYSLLVLFGSPLLEKVAETWLLCVYLAALYAYPVGAYFRGSFDAWGRAVVAPYNVNHAVEKTIVSSTLFALAGTWIGGLGLALDWQRPWLLYPTPLVLGGTLGYFAGAFYAAGCILISEFK